MIVDDIVRVDYLDTTVQPDIQYSVMNYATLGLSISGTLTTGTFTVEGTQDGVEWQELPIVQGNVMLPNNEIVNTGSYVIDVTNYTLARLIPDTFTGSVRVTANQSTRPFITGVVMGG